jgi:hypothetical protein
MPVVGLNEIVFSHAEMAEWGEERIRQDIAAGETASITISVPEGRVMFIYEYKIGDIPINIFYMRWSGIRNVVEKELLIGTEQTNFSKRPFPLPIAKGNSGTIKVRNSDVVTRTFEMTYNYFLIQYDMLEKLKEITGWKFRV